MTTSRPAGTIGELSTELIRQSRVLHGLRSHLPAWTPPGLDWAAFSLLSNLMRAGPQRQSELAGCAMLDPSTVSRHVGQLVRAGLVERRPDPLDGRAVQLAPTPAGRQMFEEVRERRDNVLREILSGWQEYDVAALVHLLRRLNDDVEAHRPAPQTEPAAPGVPVDPLSPDPDEPAGATPAGPTITRTAAASGSTG